MSSYVEILDSQSVSNTELLKQVIYIDNCNGTGEGITCENDLNRIADSIVEKYKEGDVCIGEFLNNVRAPGLSIEEAAIVYAKVYAQTDNDKVIRIADGYEINLALDEQ